MRFLTGWIFGGEANVMQHGGFNVPTGFVIQFFALKIKFWIMRSAHAQGCSVDV